MIKYKHTTELDLGDIGWVEAEVICEITLNPQYTANEASCTLDSAVVVFPRGEEKIKIDVTHLIRQNAVEDIETEALQAFLSAGRKYEPEYYEGAG